MAPPRGLEPATVQDPRHLCRGLRPRKRGRSAAGLQRHRRSHGYAQGHQGAVEREGEGMTFAEFCVATRALEIAERAQRANELTWRTIDTAPRDGTAIFAASVTHRHFGLVTFLNREWECIDMNGHPMGVG